jgi:putative intracellular protease/amidase
MPRTALFIVSAATALELADGSSMPVGYWAGELLQPWRALERLGLDLRLATPGGRVPHPDPHSLGQERQRMLQALGGIPPLQSPHVLEELPEALPDAIILPGGYAPMVDLALSAALGRLLRRAAAAGTLVAAICHAPAALLSACDTDSWCWTGYRMAVFTDAEERDWLGERRLRWTAQDALTRAGAHCEPGGLWAEQVVRDRNLLTAQNSPSCAAWTAALAAELGG